MRDCTPAPAETELFRSLSIAHELVDPSAIALANASGSRGSREPSSCGSKGQARIQEPARVLVRADGVPDEDLLAAHLEPVADVEAAVLEAAGREGRICVLPEGPQTIPYLASRRVVTRGGRLRRP